MAPTSDRIVALATPAGISALALLRVSGGDLRALAEVCLGLTPAPRAARLARYRDREGAVLDEVVATYFPAPRSYTGEDVLELSCHGNPFIVQRMLEDLQARGCRPALPGEFTQRAFLNGRMDLTQAEAVMEVIAARSERALAAAQAQLGGALGRQMAALVDALVGAAARIEAQLDFPEDDLPAEDRAEIAAILERVAAGAAQLLATRRYGDLLREGIRTVIVGEPNAGKSSLLNQLVGLDRALVSPEPGTTRDYIEERVVLGPHSLRLIDTAGLNPAPSPLEARGMGHTREQARQADLLLLVLDVNRPTPAFVGESGDLFRAEQTVVVLNQIDRLDGTERAVPPPGLPVVRISALTGAGLGELRDAIVRTADRWQPAEIGADRIAINARHAQALEDGLQCLANARALLAAHGASELIASEIRGALAACGEIAGRIDHERVLDRLFATFCIGK
jgi:tRNA modification GTPase